jgi:hypothetical protein
MSASGLQENWCVIQSEGQTGYSTHRVSMRHRTGAPRRKIPGKYGDGG